MKIFNILVKKRDGRKLDYNDFKFIAEGAKNGTIADYQLSAFLMACFINGLDSRETSYLTKAMAFSGKRLNLNSIKKPKVDKHSTGGVGDGISLALAPIVSACGVCVPMMSGRGLGHTGGTLDKLESISGFRVNLSYSHILRQLKAIDLCMFGQTQELAPADKKLYALRDATRTVESIPLIVASILSKKYAEGIDSLVMDVKFGSGAFMTDYKKAKELAIHLVNTSKMLGIRPVAVITNMNWPLGRAVGNGIEMEQSIRILKGEHIADDFEELLYFLSGYMIYIAGKASSVEHAIYMAQECVKSGRALEKFRQMVKWQMGDVRVCDNPSTFIPKGRIVSYVRANRDGYITKLDAKGVGIASVALGVGRMKAEDCVDLTAGIWFEKKYSDYVKKGEIIAKIYGSDIKKVNECKKFIIKSLEIDKKRPFKYKLISEVIL
ncbi:MAG: thymidine phosphorylase [Elusimicrobiales bacterium]|nr:thymidine phosphorylase [Elusimicrobiales bacterium]